MKKLLSILTISTLTASVPIPLLANTVQTRTKRNVITSNSNNEYLPINQISGIDKTVNSLAVDSKDNIYFGTDKGAFVLKHGATTPTKIDGINDYVYSLAFDSKNNIYIGTTYGLYVLKHGETTATKINNIDNIISVSVDSKDNIYFGTDKDAFVLKQGETTQKKLMV